MKKLISLLVILTLCLSLAISVSAADTAHVWDDAGLLTDAEASALDSKLQRISEAYQAQIVVVTVPSAEGSDTDQLLNFIYDYNELGYGENRDGVLLLICMDPREWRILSNGYAGDAITSGDIDIIGDAFVPYLSDGDYATALGIFADECEYYLNGYLNGYPFDPGFTLITSLVVGLVVALIVTAILKGQLKSVRMQSRADAYVKSGSMQLTQSGDFYMYRNITKTQRQTSSSGSSSGGSRSTGGGSF